MITNTDVKKLKEVFLTREEFNQHREEFNQYKEEFTKFKNDQMNILAKILKNTEDDRIDRTILSHRSSDHEDRLQTIESKLGIASS